MKGENIDMTQKRRDSLCGYYSAEECGYGRDYCPKGVWCPIQYSMMKQLIKKGFEDE